MSTKRILIVDDEKECCDLLKDYFAKYNYIVDIVYDSKKAQIFLKDNTYEYIIFDYYMPGFSGAEVLKVIKDKNPEAKKILISGYDFLQDETINNMGIDAFLRKPFVIEDLAAIIKER